MILLAIDTSSMVASVAVVGSAREAVVERLLGGHHDDIVALVDQALGEAGVRLGELGAVAVGAGPGSFTGLRIGMATAKGMAFAAGLPLYTASSLAGIALDALPLAPSGALVVPVVDARRGEVYAGFYRADGGLVTPAAEERVVAAADLAQVIAVVRADSGAGPAVLVGEGLAVHAEVLAAAGVALVAARATPSARSIARLVLAGPREDHLRDGTPVYLRQTAAETVFPAGNPGGLPGSSGREKK